MVELVRSPLELDPFTEAEGSPDDADTGGLDELMVKLTLLLEGGNPVEAPAAEEGAADDVAPPEVAVELPGSEVGPLVGSSDDDAPLLEGVGGDPEEGTSDGAGHEDPQGPLGQGHDPVQEPVHELGHGVLDGEGRPLEGPLVKLDPGVIALPLTVGEVGEVTEDPDEEMAGVAEVLKFPGGEPDGPVLKGTDTEPGTEDEDVLSALLDTAGEVVLPAGADEPGEVTGPVESGGVPEVIPTPLEDTSPGEVLVAGSVGALKSQLISLKLPCTYGQEKGPLDLPGVRIRCRRWRQAANGR